MAKKKSGLSDSEREEAMGLAEEAADAGDLEGLIDIYIKYEGRLDFASALSHAAFGGQAEAIRYLIPRCDPTRDNHQAFRWLIKMAGPGDQVDPVGSLKALMGTASQEAIDEGLWLLAGDGNQDLVSVLIGSSTPEGRGRALASAASNHREKCVALLTPPMDQPWAQGALEAAVKQARLTGDKRVISEMGEMLKSHQQREALEGSVKSAPVGAASKRSAL